MSAENERELHPAFVERIGKGRPPGLPNKITRAAREAFTAAFDEIGGTEALAEWARNNRGHFYTLFARLIPTEIVGAGGGPILIETSEPDYVRRRLVDIAAGVETAGDNLEAK